jgi:zeta-carotene desaturase
MSAHSPDVHSSDVLVIGAGVAGLAAATALASHGRKVTLLERRAYVGGRASSYPHPTLGEVVDCQHVLLGCCTSLLQLLRSANAEELIRWYPEQTFLEPNGNVTRLRPGVLPAPFHFAGSFLAAKMLNNADRISIARGLSEFAFGRQGRDEESAAQWFARTHQTEGAIRHFWEPLLYGTLNDAPENCSMKYAAMVFYELCIKSSQGGVLGIPRVPLEEFYGRVLDQLLSGGTEIHFRTTLESIAHTAQGWSATADGIDYTSPIIILALPWEQAQALLKDLTQSFQSESFFRSFEYFRSSPYTTVHLWFDREITALEHAWLLDGTFQFFFHKSKIRGAASGSPSYVELVAGGLPHLLKLSREEILSLAMKELKRVFPQVHGAQLRKWGILKEARATCSVLPGNDRFRPAARSPWPGLFLAGDWTASGWPSTMESAARSGYLAAGELLGVGESLAAPAIPASGFARLWS